MAFSQELPSVSYGLSAKDFLVYSVGFQPRTSICVIWLSAKNFHVYHLDLRTYICGVQTFRQDFLCVSYRISAMKYHVSCGFQPRTSMNAMQSSKNFHVYHVGFQSRTSMSGTLAFYQELPCVSRRLSAKNFQVCHVGFQSRASMRLHSTIVLPQKLMLPFHHLVQKLYIQNSPNLSHFKRPS